MLSPADIDKKRFTTTRLKEGYDQDDVDSFLDRVQEDYGFLQQTVARLEEDNRVLRRQINDAPTAVLDVRPDPPSAVAEKLLEVAAQAAAEIEAEAQAKADEIVREAGGRAAAVVEEAVEAAEKIKSEALGEKYRRIEELDRDIRAREERAASARSDGDTARRALAAALAAYDKEVGQ